MKSELNAMTIAPKAIILTIALWTLTPLATCGQDRRDAVRYGSPEALQRIQEFRDSIGVQKRQVKKKQQESGGKPLSSATEKKLAALREKVISAAAEADHMMKVKKLSEADKWYLCAYVNEGRGRTPSLDVNDPTQIELGDIGVLRQGSRGIVVRLIVGDDEMTVSSGDLGKPVGGSVLIKGFRTAGLTEGGKAPIGSEDVFVADTETYKTPSGKSVPRLIAVDVSKAKDVLNRDEVKNWVNAETTYRAAGGTKPVLTVEPPTPANSPKNQDAVPEREAAAKKLAAVQSVKEEIERIKEAMKNDEERIRTAKTAKDRQYYEGWVKKYKDRLAEQERMLAELEKKAAENKK